MKRTLTAAIVATAVVGTLAGGAAYAQNPAQGSRPQATMTNAMLHPMAWCMMPGTMMSYMMPIMMGVAPGPMMGQRMMMGGMSSGMAAGMSNPQTTMTQMNAMMGRMQAMTTELQGMMSRLQQMQKAQTAAGKSGTPAPGASK